MSNGDRSFFWAHKTHIRRVKADPCGSRIRIRNVILDATSYSYPENPIPHGNEMMQFPERSVKAYRRLSSVLRAVSLQFPRYFYFPCTETARKPRIK
jgi:hypothetical protein